jgi:HD-GYP domain-containing protein (c-di-GMP phosphodiesterase class II)
VGIAGSEVAPGSGELESRIRDLEDQLRQLRTGSICALNQMLDLKDLNTGLHSTRLAEWAVRLGEQLGISEAGLRDVEVGAILHDIGKVGVPDAILNKPTALEPEERKQVERHPEYGWAILRTIPGFRPASLFVLHHHERMDGKGYPAGLTHTEIPLGSRIISVIDAFDAMVSDRSYRKGLSAEEAIHRLLADSGTQFDSEVVRLFVDIARTDLVDVNESVEVFADVCHAPFDLSR